MHEDLNKIKFSSDLLLSALNQLEFLKEINQIRDIISRDDVIKQACFRYEHYWLPFYSKYVSTKKDNILIPPIDVEFIWHCHMLCPTEYYSDCMKLYGRLLSHSNLNRSQREKSRTLTKLQWFKEYSNISFDYSDIYSIDENEFNSFKSQITYNLYAAAQRQLQFYYQVSLPHYTNKKYLKKAIKRYKKFIYLFKLNPNEFLVPCYSIDLIWHSHQLDPESYTNDTKLILGKILNHDDSVNDRSSGSKLNTSFEKTCQLWKNAYGENYFFPGGMFRGNKTQFDITTDSIDFHIKSINIYEIVLNKLEKNQLHLELNNTDNFNLFSVKMTYLDRIKSWSDIRLFHHDKLIHLGRLTGLNELPSNDVLTRVDTNLNLKHERVFLLSDHHGDYALIKGKCKRKSSSINDSLTVSYYSLNDNQIKYKLEMKHNQKYLEFKFEHFQVRVDLKLATVRIESSESLFKDNKHVVSCLFMFLFSLICLYLPLIENMQNDFLMFNLFRINSSDSNDSSSQIVEQIEMNNHFNRINKSSKTNCGCFS